MYFDLFFLKLALRNIYLIAITNRSKIMSQITIARHKNPKICIIS